MSLKKTRFVKGIIIAPDSIALDGLEGEFKVDSTTGKIQTTLKDGANPSAAREIITSSQTQELTNKTVTSPVINTGVSGTAIDIDGTLAANSDTKLASQKAVKTYVDAQVASKDQASEISYSNVTSGLVATNVQTAIDEVEGRLQTAEGTLSGHISQLVDAHDASAISSIPSGNLVATDVQGALNELQTDVDTRATSSALTTHTGASSGVHGVTGSVVGTTDNQTLTTKTIDADNNTISNLETDNLKTGVLNTSTSLSGASNTQIPSALAVKTYVDALPAAIIVSQTSFSIANNQSALANITGLIFNPALFRGVKIEYSMYSQTDTLGSARAQRGQLRFVYNTQEAKWLLSDDFAGQDSGVTFEVDDTSGQVKYTSSDLDPVNSNPNYVGTLKYSLIKTFGV
jgi:hypothetical protein